MQGILLIVNANSVDPQSLATLRALLASVAHQHPQLATAQVLQVPLSDSQLQHWRYWVAGKIVEYWLQLPAPGLSVPLAMARLGLERSTDGQELLPLLTSLRTGALGISLTADLSAQVAAIQHRYELLRPAHGELQQWLEGEVATIANWFSYEMESFPGTKLSTLEPAQLQMGAPGLFQLQTNRKAQQQRLKLQFQEVLLSWRQSGLRPTLQFLSALGERLTAVYTEFEERRQNYLWRETSAWRAFYNLKSQLQQRTFPGRRREVELDAVFQGLQKACSFKLEAEIYAQAGLLVGELKKEVHLQSLALTQTSQQLGAIRGRFLQKSQGKPIFAPMFKQHMLGHPERLQQLRQELETRVGYPFSRWGELSPAQIALIWQRVLELGSQISSEVYAQCYVGLKLSE